MSTAGPPGRGVTRTPTRRRAFLRCVGVTALAGTPLARAADLPIVGFLGATTAAPQLVKPFLEGLAEGGYVDGRNVVVRYRWADNQRDRLPALAAELVAAPAAVLVTNGGTPAARAAREATSTTPIVFEVGIDPATAGLVASLARPGGNATGIYIVTGALNAKRLQYLHEMVPRATTIALLVKPGSLSAPTTESQVRAAAEVSNLRVIVVGASDPQEIDVALQGLAAGGVRALIVGNDPFFNSLRDHLVAATVRHALPAIFEWREFAVAGGLMSYGSDFSAAHRQLGTYVARILRGARPAELPVVQPDRFELVINSRTAARLGLTIPRALRLRAEIVE